MPAVSTKKMTARQYLELGEDPPGVRLELVDGEIEVSPSPTPRHSRVVMQLGHILIGHTESGQGGEIFTDVDTIFGEHDVRRPDVLYFAPDRLHLIGDKAMEGPPDLAVEVISPSSIRHDREMKYKLYEAGGVRCYWVVDPAEQTFEAFEHYDGRYRLVVKGTGDEAVAAPPFADLSIRLSRLWMK